MFFIYKENKIMNKIKKILTNNNYIKLNDYLYIKNVNSNIITGSFVLVNIKDKVSTYLSLQNKLLFFKIKPKLKVKYKYYSSIYELNNIINHNNLVEYELGRMNEHN